MKFRKRWVPSKPDKRELTRRRLFSSVMEVLCQLNGGQDMNLKNAAQRMVALGNLTLRELKLEDKQP